MPNALNDLLKATSRPFYLIPHCGTLPPAAVRPQIGLAPRLVPKAQPEISQPQGGWYRPTKFDPSWRDGGKVRASIQFGNFHRPFRTNFLSNLDQTLRVWLISNVALRHWPHRIQFSP
jgi:hypothetical protein